MFGDLASDDGGGIILPPEGDEPLAAGDARDARAAAGQDEIVLQFPVEIEVRLVAAYDQEQLVDAALDRLTTALRGLA